MAVPDLDRMDWNLVPALHALLSEQNVSRAARRLGVSQPAVSNALARLRRHFRDDLLVRHGNRYSLTPLAEQLAPLALDAVSANRSILASSRTFDPATTSRTFTIASTEYGQVLVGSRLVSELRTRAPGAQLRFVTPFASSAPGAALELVASTDGWIAPAEVLPGTPSTGHLADQWALVVADDHPDVPGDLGLDDLARLAWVVPTVRGNPLTLQLGGLAACGITPCIEVTTESFTAVPYLVAGSRRIGLLQRGLALRLAPSAGVRVVPCPWAVTPLNLTMWWDAQREDEPAHRWLRDVVARSMAAEDASLVLAAQP